MTTTTQCTPLALLVFIVSLTSSSLLNSQTKNFIDQAYLETTAKADTLVIPDRIYLDIILKESDSKNRISVEELEHKMVQQLTALGIVLDEQLSLKDASTDFNRYFLKGQEIEKRKQFQLLVYDGLTVGRIIQSLEAIGISNITLTKLEYSQMEALELALKSQAILKAKAQAEALVSPLGQKVTQALHIVDRNYLNNRNLQYDLAEAEMRKVRNEGFEAIALNFHKIHVISEVSVKFKLE